MVYFSDHIGVRVVISTESSLPGITVTHLFTLCWTGIYGTHFIDNNLVNNVNISSVSDNYVLNILQTATNNPFKIIQEEI